MIKVSAQSCNMSVAGEQRTPPYVLFLPVISVLDNWYDVCVVITIIGEHHYSIVPSSTQYIYNYVRL